MDLLLKGRKCLLDEQITEKLQFPECDVYETDAKQPFEEEILKIKGIIWDKLVGKYS